MGAVFVSYVGLILRLGGLSTGLPTVVTNLLAGLAWAGIAPLAAALARRLPIVGPRWGRHLLAHVAFATVADAAIQVFVISVTQLMIPPGSREVVPTFVYNFVGSLPFHLLLWLVVVAAVHAYDYAWESRERERQTAQLEAQLATAQLGALRAQLDPHFLFNTLNAASTLMARDVRAARAVLGDLSALLRLSLDRMTAPEVPLANEVDFLRHYLDIEQTRYEDRLSVSVRVEDGLEDALVPPLVLQPLVENALKHAVAPRPDGGRVEVRVRAEDGALVLSVEDDGPGLPEAGPRPGGIGLQNTRDRLASLYGHDASLALDSSDAGLTAVVRLPLHVDALVRLTP